jgi:hypothetical protein
MRRSREGRRSHRGWHLALLKRRGIYVGLVAVEVIGVEEGPVPQALNAESIAKQDDSNDTATWKNVVARRHPPPKISKGGGPNRDDARHFLYARVNTFGGSRPRSVAVPAIQHHRDVKTCCIASPFRLRVATVEPPSIRASAARTVQALAAAQVLDALSDRFGIDS